MKQIAFLGFFLGVFFIIHFMTSRVAVYLIFESTVSYFFIIIGGSIIENFLRREIGCAFTNVHNQAFKQLPVRRIITAYNNKY